MQGSFNICYDGAEPDRTLFSLDRHQPLTQIDQLGIGAGAGSSAIAGANRPSSKSASADTISEFQAGEWLCSALRMAE
jgi:hypothetical protein